MDYNINYRGLVINMTINENETTVWFIKNGNKYTFDIADRQSSKKTKLVTIPFTLKIEDSDGTILNTKQDKYTTNGNTYSYFYNLVANRAMGDFLDRGSVNVVLEKYFNEPVYPFNIVDNYNEMQPIIYDLDVVDSNVSVSLVNYDATKTLKYSLDGNNWQDSNTFSNLDNGGYTMYVKTEEEGYKFMKSFNINALV